ncbi:transposase [Mycobacterium simulans]|uniref:transposase n=1 Tax=Mycobacterium simulans TaxID=627089 RepID=UPI00163FDF6C|nr:transposase [Mycobacterium simulans]
MPRGLLLAVLVHRDPPRKAPLGVLRRREAVGAGSHLVKLSNDALTKVRRRVTRDLHDRRGRKIDSEWANRRRLLRARERLSQKSFAKM